jgi:hypothetical protein
MRVFTRSDCTVTAQRVLQNMRTATYHCSFFKSMSD